MPRKAAKKDTEATEAKNEEVTTRRSGRSRRSSTAAQTAASVADSKAPKARGSVSSRRDSSSSTEAPASRSKAARRSTGKVNYQESDGEEESTKPKVDEEFNSGDEFEESESEDESLKPKGKVGRSPAKGRGGAKKKGRAKAKASPRGRRGRPMKKKKDSDEEDEEEEMVEISDDSGEAEVVVAKKVKEPAKSSRGRRLKPKVTEEIDLEDEKPKSSGRRSRGAAAKEQATPPKRPSRNVRAKRYTEDEVEEIGDAEEVDEGTRKRKRSASPDKESKRLKEDAEGVTETPVEDATKETEEEAMEVDEPSLPETKTEEGKEPGKLDDKDPEEVVKDKEMEDSSTDIEKQPSDKANEQQAVETSDTAEVTKTEPNEQDSKPKATNEEPSPEATEKSSVTPESSKPEDKPITEKITEPMVFEHQTAELINEPKLASVPPPHHDDSSKYDSSASDESKPLTIDETLPSPTEAAVPQPTETTQEAILNGSEKTDKPPTVSKDTQPAPTANSEHVAKSTPTENGAHNDVPHADSKPVPDPCYSLPGRKYVYNSKLSDSIKESVKDQIFGFVSYNLGKSQTDAYMHKDKLLNELNNLDARIICLQQVAKPFFTTVLEPSLDALGFKSMFYLPGDSLKGIATFYKASLFRPTKQTEISLKQLVEKELESSTLSFDDKAAVKSHLKKCGNVLFIQFETVVGTQSLTVANVQIPPTDLSVHALQVSCLAREVVKINGGTNVPLLLGGEFNLSENDASYQLLKDGYLSNDMIEELQRRKDVVLPGKENKSLVNLLWNLFQHMSSNLCSCYKSVLDHEFVIPETKKTSPDLLWFSSNSLHIVGVLDIDSDTPTDHNFSLKADIAFSV